MRKAIVHHYPTLGGRDKAIGSTITTVRTAFSRSLATITVLFKFIVRFVYTFMYLP